MEEIFNSISRILSEKPGNRIDFKRHIVADDGEEIDGIELLQYYFPKPAEIILWFYDNTKPLKDYSEDTIQRIYKKVKTDIIKSILLAVIGILYSIPILISSGKYD